MLATYFGLQHNCRRPSQTIKSSLCNILYSGHFSQLSCWYTLICEVDVRQYANFFFMSDDLERINETLFVLLFNLKRLIRVSMITHSTYFRVNMCLDLPYLSTTKSQWDTCTIILVHEFIFRTIVSGGGGSSVRKTIGVCGPDTHFAPNRSEFWTHFLYPNRVVMSSNCTQPEWINQIFRQNYTKKWLRQCLQLV